MQSINKLADKLSTPHNDSYAASTTTSTTLNGGGMNITDKHIGFANDVNMSQQAGFGMTQQAGFSQQVGMSQQVTTGQVIEQHQVGTVDVVETTQTVKKVPVVETTRVLETGVAGMSVHEHDHLHKHDHHHKEGIAVAGGVAVAATAVHVDLPVTVDHQTVVAPVVVDEHLRKDVLVEVQPVIHKEIEVQEVHHVTKHINEAAAPSLAGSVTLAPVIQEHVHTHVIEEVHPVIHREVVLQEVVHEEKHITEHIVAPTRHISEVYTEVAPVHIHDAHCHHEIATERLTNVILPGTVGLPASHVATTVTSREVLSERAGAAVVVGQTSTVVGGNAQFVGGNTQIVGGNTQFVGGNAQFVGGNTQIVGSNTHVDMHGHAHGLAHAEAHAHGHAHAHAVGTTTTGLLVDDRIHVDKVVATKHGHGMTTTRNGVVEEVVLKPGDELLLAQNNITGDAVLLEKRHNGHVVVDGHAHTDAHADAKHHHHLHLPHFLGGHKKDEVVVTETTTTKHSVL